MKKITFILVVLMFIFLDGPSLSARDDFDNQTKSIIRKKQIIIWQVNNDDLVSPKQIAEMDNVQNFDTLGASVNLKSMPNYDEIFIYVFCHYYQGEDHERFDRMLRDEFEDAIIFSTAVPIKTDAGKSTGRMFYILQDSRQLPDGFVKLNETKIENLPAVLEKIKK